MRESAPEPLAPAVPSRASKARRILVQRIFIVAFVLVLIAGAYYFMQYQKLKNDPAIEAREEAQKVVKELSKLMIVPEEASPIIATVSDKDQLAGQPFFQNAENGDQVVIFPASMKAVLYRPSTHKIVDIAPLAGAGAPQVPQAQAPLPPEPDEETAVTEPEDEAPADSTE